jgi:hypothetical protein
MVTGIRVSFISTSQFRFSICNRVAKGKSLKEKPKLLLGLADNHRSLVALSRSDSLEVDLLLQHPQAVRQAAYFRRRFLST